MALNIKEWERERDDKLYLVNIYHRRVAEDACRISSFSKDDPKSLCRSFHLQN